MKYLEGNIFVNFYIFGLAGFVAVLIGAYLYSTFGLKTTYILSLNMSILGCIGMLIVQMKWMKFDSQVLRDQFDEKLMPVLILCLKIGIIVSFITTTQVSFNDDRIFPSNRRNTSVGTCGMIARSITILAPIVNEWQTPIPIVIMLLFSVIGVFTSLTFPSEDQQLRSEIYNPNEKEEDESQVSFHNISKEMKLNDKESSKSTDFESKKHLKSQ